ncbi:SDR family NAD(P)-dependent oxidoreductase [Streptomyces sp. NPDC087903]|uniref:SDR family NAD(P)-dependent oxidoreductase n=1 Tax=Streptomyces sp. NPDC087903 TaxID=3365819 RepID=UPI0038234FC3
MPKTIVITGTASGLGFATVEKFTNEGWNVVATTRDGRNPFPERANVRVLPLDVTDMPAVAAFGALATEQFGPVDVLVNNAGYYQMGPLETSAMEQIRAQYETNVFGLIALTQSFLPAMRARKSGMIINLASISADNGYPYTTVYGSSKAAVLSLTEALNVELTPPRHRRQGHPAGFARHGHLHQDRHSRGVPDRVPAAVPAFRRSPEGPDRFPGLHRRRRDLGSGQRRQRRLGPLVRRPGRHLDPGHQAAARTGALLHHRQEGHPQRPRAPGPAPHPRRRRPDEDRPQQGREGDPAAAEVGRFRSSPPS